MLPVQNIFRMEKEGRMSHEQQTTLPIHYFGKSGLALLKLPFIMVFVLCVLYAWGYWLWSLFTEGSGNFTALMFIAVFILLPVTGAVVQSAIEILSLAGNNKPLLTLNEQGVVYKGRVVRWSDIVSIQLGHENRHAYAHHIPDVAISLHPSAVESPRDAIMWIALRDVKAEEYLLMRQLKHYWHLYREVAAVESGC